MSTPDFARMVPGFDFLQGLMKGASASVPGMSQWIAPTLDAEEVDKRIQELRTVQFWLEQNARMLAASIQALEVQRMTLATLRTMNVPMDELRASMKLDPAATAEAARPAAAPEPEPKGDAPASAKPPPAADPLQWWGALTRQFSDLAAQALQDMPAAAAAAAAAKTASGHKGTPKATTQAPPKAPRKASVKRSTPAPSPSTPHRRKAARGSM